MPLTRVANYELGLYKGNYSYRFQIEGSGWTKWEGVHVQDFAAVAAIFATNNAYYDAGGPAFVSGSSIPDLINAATALPLVAKKKQVTAGKNSKTTKSATK